MRRDAAEDPVERALARHRRLTAEGRRLGRDLAAAGSGDPAAGLALRLMIADLERSGAALAELASATGAAIGKAAEGFSASRAYLAVGRDLHRAA
jgi:hypothetical protein